MDDLLNYLYKFTLEHRIGGLRDDREYQECVIDTDQQTRRVEGYLNEEQRRELHQMIDKISIQNSAENEYIFRAAIRLARELNALVGA